MKTKRRFSRVLAALLCVQMTFTCISNAGMPVYAAESVEEASSETVVNEEIEVIPPETTAAREVQAEVSKKNKEETPSQPAEAEKGTEEKPADVQVQEDVHVEEAASNPSEPEQIAAETSAAEQTQVENQGAAEETHSATETESTATSGSEEKQTDTSSETVEEKPTDGDSAEELQTTSDEETVQETEGSTDEESVSSEETIESASEEETQEDLGETEPEEKWNAAPITGEASTNGATILVSAKEGSFPEGTVLHIDTLDKGKTDGIIQMIGTGTEAIGFDITFVSTEGSRIQPRDGYAVDIQFRISNSCILADPDETGATLHVYHIGDEGNADRLKSVSAPSQGTVQIDLQATDFSPYLVVKEEAAARRAPSEETRAETVSSNLADFLTGVAIDAPQDENGNYVINPSSIYEITFTFRENETTQFDNEAVLTYDFPEGLLVSDVGSTSFSITVKDENGTATVSDNTFEVVDGQLRVRFNQNDPNYSRLTAAANVKFDVTISSTFDQTVGEITFNPSIVKDFVYENNADLTITKSVVYDKDTDTATYTLQVTSAGTNDNVVIEDHLTGTALTFNKDVTVESNVSGQISAAPDYDAVENGFRVTIPQMSNGEVLTLHYTASVDNTKISSNGTVEQTNNTARVSSDEVPDPKEASADFAGQADFQRVAKRQVGEPVDNGDGTYTVSWLIRFNEDHKMEMGGTELHDWITTNSRPFMVFSGDGITVNVTLEDGTTETRVLSWDDLRLNTNEYGIYGWNYMTPASDGKASYEITCTTLVNTAGALNTLTLANGAQVYNSYDEDSVSIGVIGENTFSIKKESLGTTSTESEWQISVDVPGSGLPSLRVTDDMPRLQYEGQTYIDYLVDGSMEVDGLLENESYRISFDNDNRTFNLFFYKSEDQSSSNQGVLPTTDGEPRTIVIRFKTAVDQDWLSMAAENGYSPTTFARHRNTASARSGDFRLPSVSADAYPVKPVFEKYFLERTETTIDGVTYPVFRYALSMSGVTEDGISIHDAFNTEYLKYYEGGGLVIKGSYTPGSSDYNVHGNLSVSETSDGIDITVAQFPKQSTQAFYPYYLIEYSLIVKSQEALNALNEEASQSQDGVYLANTATWNGITSQSHVSYTYFPYVDKELLARPTADNGYVADFKVMINQYSEDLDPTSDVLTIRDVLSSNLRFLPDSIVITPANDAITVQHDADTNTVTFDNVPDETAFEITYQARVLGNGNVTYSNTIQFGKFEKTIEEETTVSSSGGGTASNPSITIIKRDAENISTMLAGAVFQLYYLDNAGSRVPVQDKNGQNVTVTTGADGTALIAGNQQQLGWTLWEDRTYCLVELTAPSGYEMNEEPTYFILSEVPSSQMEYDLTGDYLYISNAPEKTSVSVTKKWVGPELNEVVVHLFAGEEDTGKTLTLTAAENWSGTFSNLRKYDDNGNEITYSVQEDRLEHYEPDYSGSAATGYVIINRNTETVELPVRKLWVGPAAEEVTVELLRSYEADGVVTVESTGLTLVLGDDNNWTDTFKNLDKYAPNGTAYVYQVNEIDVDGYVSEIAYAEDGSCTITNTNNETINIPVTKQWIGTPADAVTISLYADNTLQEEIELTAKDNWEHTFENLPKYDHVDGHEIAYDVRETPVEGYVPGRSGSVSTGFTFTNTITGKVSIPVTKVWIGPALDSVTIELLANGTKADEAELSEENSWQYTFADLEKYNNGVEIKYEIQELDLDGYSSGIAFAEDGSCTITNTNIETISIPVTKQWVGTPVDAVTISLYADNTLQEEIELTAEDNWEHTFENLPKYDHADGHEIAYDVRETPVEGYVPGRSGSVSTGFTFTNTITGKVSIPVTKVWIGPALDSVTIELLADGTKADEAELSEENSWQYTFADLEKYNNGVEIKYEIQELDLVGYSSDIVFAEDGSCTITNTNTETIDIPVTKRWIGPAAESATVVLKADGVEIDSVVLSEAENWSHEFKSLLKYDQTDGHEILYTVEEKDIPGYKAESSGNITEGIQFTNTNLETLDIPVEKKWIGPEAEAVIIILTADGTEKERVLLNGEANWKHTFTDLLKYDKTDGHEIVYEVSESELDGYKTEKTGTIAEGVVFTNTNAETLDIPVTKRWVGPAGTEATIRLTADGLEAGSVVLSEENGWAHTFKGLSKYDPGDGHEIEYKITEDDIENYISGISGTPETGFTVTNTITGKVSVPVTKKWVGPAAEIITVHLYADEAEAGSIELSQENNWQYTFEDLDKYNDGIEIKYTVKEDPVEGYNSEITGNATDGFFIQNTNEETIDVPVTKVWVGKTGSSVTVHLFADDVERDKVVLNEEGAWKHTFTNLPKYSSIDGHEISYSITEDSVEGYKTGISGTMETGFTVTNTITGKVSVPVTKKWVGAAADKVTVYLLADGKRIDEVELSSANNWNYVFTGLAQYKDGEEIDYTVLEDVPSGYESTITGTAESGYVIINKNVKTTDIPVTKKWVGKEGGSITVRLYADGKELRKAIVTKDSQWKYTFSGLPLYDGTDGHKISYTVTEDTLKDYTSGITGSAEDGFVITNTYDKETPETPSPKTPDQKTPETRTNSTPKTGDESNLTGYLVLMIISGGLLLWLFLRRKKIYRRQ